MSIPTSSSAPEAEKQSSDIYEQLGGLKESIAPQTSISEQLGGVKSEISTEFEKLNLTEKIQQGVQSVFSWFGKAFETLKTTDVSSLMGSFIGYISSIKFDFWNNDEEEDYNFDQPENQPPLDKMISFYSDQIEENITPLVQGGKKYTDKNTIVNYDGTTRMIQNHCVGFTMLALQGLPFKVKEKFASAYKWNKKDGYVNYIPEMADHDSSRYITIEELPTDSNKINKEIAPHLQIGEFAIATFYNHIFLIRKVIENGKVFIKMFHSGAHVDENGKVNGDSRSSETTLSGYAKFMKRNNKPMHFRFLPLSQIIDVSSQTGNKMVAGYYTQNQDTASV